MVKNDYKKYFDLDKITEDVDSYLPKFNKKLFLEAFVFAEKAHRGQLRKDKKTPYIVHPLAAVEILVSLHSDQDVLISALLHDVPEDTKYDIKEVKSKFGKEVAFLVDGITKLSKVQYQHNMPERDVESLKKLFLHSAKDVRVILIKLADRLHNMRTLFNVNPEKRIRIATETLEIFVPMANLLGINKLKTELEDLCFNYLFPTEHDKLKIKIKDSNERNKVILKDFVKVLQKELKKVRIENKIFPRDKGVYRAYKRICSKGKTIDNIKDRIALKIIVDSIPHCYEVLGIVHGKFIPRPNSFKDYIANSKPNGYQSLHTIVFGMDGILTEIQIQTEKMHREAEYGIASHFFDKEENSKRFNISMLLDDKRSEWVNKVLELEKDHGAESDFLADLKLDILHDRIFVFTPKGRTIDLPNGASVIDFAYDIHSDVGNHAVKAELNNEVVPITKFLKTGDVVKVLTKKDAYPELYWLSFSKTNLAKNKIIFALKKKGRQKKIYEGKNLLQKEFDIAGLGLCDDLNFKRLKISFNDLFKKNLNTIRDVYAGIGEGSIRALNVINFLKNYQIQNKKGIYKEKKNKNNDLKISLKIIGKNRFGLLKDISAIMYQYAKDMIYLKGWTAHSREDAYFRVKLVVDNTDAISKIFGELEQIDDIKTIYRVSGKGLIYFYLISIFTAAFWTLHPFALYYLTKSNTIAHHYISDPILIVAVALLLFSILYLTRILKKYFPFLRNKKKLWGISFIISTFAVLILSFELQYFHFHISWILMLGFLLLLYLYLGINYFKSRDFFNY
jgi:GTP diphosphokinase / guanosine-3',5'-bis(diphosphate) 3'-diphosphatase